MSFTPKPKLHRRIRWPFLWGTLLMVSFALGATACDRPLEVKFSGAGAKDLGLLGERKVDGTLGRSLMVGGKVIPKGSKLRLSETFLVRKDGGKPPSYRFKGLYDPSKRNDGLILPEGSTDVIYVCLVKPDMKQRIAVPKRYFERDPQP